MRSYYVAAAAGVLLIVSAFLPWMFLGDESVGGVPDPAGFWILALGVIAVCLPASASGRARIRAIRCCSSGSRHLPSCSSAINGCRAPSETPHGRGRRPARSSKGCLPERPPETRVGLGIYLGLVAAAIVLVLFGLDDCRSTTKVPRRPYAAHDDDDQQPTTDD